MSTTPTRHDRQTGHLLNPECGHHELRTDHDRSEPRDKRANHDFAQTKKVDYNRRANMKVRCEHVVVPLIATCPRTATSSQPPAWLRRTFMASMTSPSRFPAACHQKSSFGWHGIVHTCGGCTSRRWRHVCSPQRSFRVWSRSEQQSCSTCHY